MFSSIRFAALALALVAPTVVNAHGYVKSYQMGGQTYSGWLPFTDPYESPVPSRIERKIPSDAPITDATSPDIACNQGGESGVKAYGTVEAGSPITFEWTNWPADHQGPVSTYMASCNGDCSSLKAPDAKWFKIDAAGYSNGKWAATQLIENGNQWTSTVPKELKAGEYLVRHEIVALHSVGQPQYYPGCAQVKVTGGGSQVPSGSSLVSLPGLYNNVKWPDIWSDSFKSFNVPGPAVAFSGSSSGSNDSDSAPSSSSAASHVASSTQVHTSAATSAHASASSAASRASSASHASSVVSASAPSSTGRCSTKRSRRGMVKRHVSHHAKRHH